MVKKIFVVDTSAVLSGRILNIGDAEIVTSLKISKELKPGGRDYRNFQYLKEKGLKIIQPEEEIVKKVVKTCKKYGEKERLSDADIELLAISYQLQNEDYKPVILTDDFSIQNIAEILKIEYQNINQRKIKEKFKWETRCQGCGKKFKDNINICPICGAKTKKIIGDKTKI